MYYKLTLKSRNEKTGPIPVSTSSRETCPDACPLKNAGCYAEGFKLSQVWDKVTAGNLGATDFDSFCHSVAALPDNALWRHNQAGDLPGENNKIDKRALKKLVKANKGKRGFTYTHKPPTKSNIAAIANANENGFTINLSANNLKHADTLAKTGLPVVVILPKAFGDNGVHHIVTAGNNSVIQCPATYRDNVTCKSCGLCALSKNRAIVGFPAHGTGKNSVDRIARL